ncbi:hypothetical protein L1887_49838 [Cichorium endivia]|nr:hypothetical protein L1887_49838 [Cichorium endivia]
MSASRLAMVVGCKGPVFCLTLHVDLEAWVRVISPVPGGRCASRSVSRRGEVPAPFCLPACGVGSCGAVFAHTTLFPRREIRRGCCRTQSTFDGFRSSGGRTATALLDPASHFGSEPPPHPTVPCDTTAAFWLDQGCRPRRLVVGPSMKHNRPTCHTPLHGLGVRDYPPALCSNSGRQCHQDHSRGAWTHPKQEHRHRHVSSRGQERCLSLRRLPPKEQLRTAKHTRPNYLPGKSPSPLVHAPWPSSSSVSMSKAEASRPASSTPYRIRLPKPALDWLPGAHNQKWEATAEGYKAVQQPSNFRIHAKAAKIKAVSVIAPEPRQNSIQGMNAEGTDARDPPSRTGARARVGDLADRLDCVAHSIGADGLEVALNRRGTSEPIRAWHDLSRRRVRKNLRSVTGAADGPLHSPSKMASCHSAARILSSLPVRAELLVELMHFSVGRQETGLVLATDLMGLVESDLGLDPIAASAGDSICMVGTVIDDALTSLVVGDASGEVVVTQIPIAGYLAVCFGSAFDLESGCCDTPSERDLGDVGFYRGHLAFDRGPRAVEILLGVDDPSLGGKRILSIHGRIRSGARLERAAPIVRVDGDLRHLERAARLHG